MKQGTKRLLYGLYLLIAVGVVAWIALRDPQMQHLDQAIAQVNLRWLFGVFGCMLVFWLLDAGVLHALFQYVQKKCTWLYSIKLALIGLFYGALTPCQSGSQPAQLVYMKRDGMSASVSTPLLASKFLLWQIAEGTIATITIPFCWNFVHAINPYLLIVLVIGYMINAAAIIAGVLVIWNQNAVRKLSRFVVRIGLKMRILKDQARWETETEQFIQNYKSSIDLLFAHKKTAVLSLVLTFLEILTYFGVTYFIYLACTGHVFSLMRMLEIISIQSVLTMSVTFIPVPGATGASEGGFYLYFASVFPGSMMFIGMMLWRLATYYMNLLAGVVMLIVDALTGKRKPLAPDSPPQEE